MTPAVTTVHSQARMYLRPLRGVHKQYPRPNVVTYEAMLNIKRIRSHLSRRMCVCNLAVYPAYT
jgi:hypothetical protein